MLPNINPKQMQSMLKQMGINSRELNRVTRVVIENGEERIIISEPQVVEITMQGQISYQISGKVNIETALKEEDVKMVMEQAKCNEEQAKKALKKFDGDIAQAILNMAESNL